MLYKGDCKKMTKLQLYLLKEDENRNKILDFKEAKHILKTKCKKAFNAPSSIYRGTMKDLKYYLVTPSDKFLRPSAHTRNYYTLIINNDPSWSKFPKRQIICSTSKEISRGYGSLYNVFPFDGAKIGICASEDIWSSFIEGFFRLSIFNKELEKLMKENPETYSDLKKTLQSIKIEDINWNDIKQHRDYISEIQWIMKKMKKEYDTLWDFVIDLYSPKNFNVVKVGSKLPYDREVWTDAPCLLINNKHIEEFLYD